MSLLNNEEREKYLNLLLSLGNDEKSRVDKLIAEIESCKRSLDYINKLIEPLKNDKPAHIKFLIEHDFDAYKKFKAANAEISNFLESVIAEAKKQNIDFTKNFPLHFERSCAESGIDIDRTSRHPKYKVCNSFIEVEVIEHAQEIKIFNRENIIALVPCDMSSVIQTILMNKKRLFERKFNPKDFLKKLMSNYSYLIKKEKMPESSSLPIRKITRRMGKNVKGFKTDEFLIDLSKLLKEPELNVNGYTLDLQHTKDDRMGMLLHGYEHRGYVGFIVFKKEKTNEQ